MKNWLKHNIIGLIILLWLIACVIIGTINSINKGQP